MSLMLKTATLMVTLQGSCKTANDHYVAHTLDLNQGNVQICSLYASMYLRESVLLILDVNMEILKRTCSS
jgi:hypothetical protein